MLKKIKNLQMYHISIDDLGITVLANSIYDLESKPFENSDDLINQISLGNITFIKYESPEELYSRIESLRYLSSGIANIPKVSSTGENIVLRNEHAHLPNNNTINWTSSKYLLENEKFSEIMHIPLGQSITLNTFTSGSFSTASSVILEYYTYNPEYQTYIRINPDIRLNEYYMSNVRVDLTSSSSTLNVSNIGDFETGLIYQIESINDKIYRKIISIDINNSTITIDLPIIDFNNVSPNAKICLIDRPIAENNSQLSTTKTSWISPLRFSGDQNPYLKLTLINKDISEPSVINSIINGWIGEI